MAGKFEDLRFEVPFVVHEAGSRALHFTLGEIQSRMCLERPDELDVDYTRTMMGFLLLNPRPRNITMIGLGGGSLAKFCHRHLSTAPITVIENNPGVIALRREFNIPDDDARLSVLADDGAAFMRRPGASIDVLLVDGFDPAGQPAQLCSQAFYDACFRALGRSGVMVANLHYDHPGHELFIERIARSFKGNAMQVLAEERSNCIVFAARGRPVTAPALRSTEWTVALDAQAQGQLKSEFARICWNAAALAIERRQP